MTRILAGKKLNKEQNEEEWLFFSFTERKE